ncbi:MAG TPA: zinc ribbon domain-containing protein [Phototrophicaceae bacterium]|nr:zinc ribbon domain-containing protein [Phototrophicaceae bacterium]
MPTYDYRCNQCGRPFALFYKSYRDYDAAMPVCPHCDSPAVSRQIKRVAIAKPSPNFSQMSSGEMLSVLDGGNSREIGRLFQQVGDSAGVDMGETYTEAGKRLAQGDSIEHVEKDLRAQAGSTEKAAGDP